MVVQSLHSAIGGGIFVYDVYIVYTVSPQLHPNCTQIRKGDSLLIKSSITLTLNLILYKYMNENQIQNINKLNKDFLQLLGLCYSILRSLEGKKHHTKVGEMYFL